MDAAKVHLTKEKETLLATLYARAVESRSADPILRDEMAEGAVQRIDYDYDRLKVNVLPIVMRARLFDLWTSEYLAVHPNAVVLQLGCGLDSRVYRLDPPLGVTWIDVDYPEVIELRRRVYPERVGHEMIGSSLADLAWMGRLPADRPAWVLLEGVSMYLSQAVMGQLVAAVTSHFPRGEIAFDALSPAATRMARRNRSLRATGATFGGFGLDDPNELKRFAPALELVRIARTPEMPGYAKLPVATRAAVRIVDSVGFLRKLSRILHYRF